MENDESQEQLTTPDVQEASIGNNIPTPKPLTGMQKFFASKVASTALVVGVAGLGIASMALTGGVSGLAASALAIEIYKVTPAYETFTKTRIGAAMHQGMKMMFSRANRRGFRLACAAIAIGVTGGIGGAVIGGINITAAAYNIYKEVKGLRTARKLCKQATHANKYLKANQSLRHLKQAIPDKLLDGLDLGDTPPQKIELPPPPKLSTTFIKSVVANFLEGAAAASGIISNLATGNITSTIIAFGAVSTTAEVTRDARGALNASSRNRILNGTIDSTGVDRQDLQAKATQQVAAAQALEHVMSSGIDLDDKEQFQQAFKEKRQALMDKMELPVVDIPLYTKVAQAVVNLVKDMWSLHTSPLNDPTPKTYKNYELAQANTPPIVKSPEKVIEQFRDRVLAHNKGAEVAYESSASQSLATPSRSPTAQSLETPSQKTEKMIGAMRKEQQKHTKTTNTTIRGVTRGKGPGLGL